jgi:SOS-response transcriptional repressor LexA
MHSLVNTLPHNSFVHTGHIMGIREELQRHMDLAGDNPNSLARKSGVTQATIWRILNTVGYEPKDSNVSKLAKHFGVSNDELWGRVVYDNVTNEAIKGRVPLINEVQVFEWNTKKLAPTAISEWLECPRKHGSQTFAMRVRGDSMASPFGRSYQDGCIVFVDPDVEPTNGCRVIAKLDGTNIITFRVYVQDAGQTWLKPINPQHPSIMDQFTVIGTVIGKWEDE